MNNTPTPRQQHLLIETTKLMLKLQRDTPHVIGLLKRELRETDFSLMMLRRPLSQCFWDKVIRGYPFWPPIGGYAKWFKQNKPKIISEFIEKGEEDEEN